MEELKKEDSKELQLTNNNSVNSVFDLINRAEQFGENKINIVNWRYLIDFTSGLYIITSSSQELPL